MIRTLLRVMTTGRVTPTAVLPALPEHALLLPTVTPRPCVADAGCRACLEACPTGAITVLPEASGAAAVTVDRGRCLTCGGCTDACPTGTLAPDRDSATASRSRLGLLRSNRPLDLPPALPASPGLFRRSLAVREVSTGDSASDGEVQAATNPIFDAARYGVHVVASPRHADALVVTGPVGRAMQEPLRRCHEAMAEPRLVVAVGCAAVSGGLHAGGYAAANGVDAVLPVDVYVPGNPPHPWMILHGLLLAMGHPLAVAAPDPGEMI